MAAKIKLTYFAGRGRGELARLVLAAAEATYENVRIPLETWPQVKESAEFEQFPFGSLPVLEYNGLVLAQSITIGRFLANKYGLAGESEQDKAKADMVVDLVLDYYDSLKRVFFTTDEDKPAKAKKCIDEDVPKILRQLEKLLRLNKTGFFVGKSLTWADISVFENVSTLVDPTSPTFGKRMPWFDHEKRVKLINDLPLLQELLATVKANPGIAKWLKERPSNETEPF